MKFRTIGQKIVTGFALLTLIGVIQGVISYRLLLPINERATFMKVDAVPGTIAILKINALLVRTDALVHGLVFSAVEEQATFDEQIRSKAAEITGLLAAYEKTITQTVDRQLFNEAGKRRSEFIAAFAEISAFLAAGKSTEAIDCFDKKARPAAEQLEASLDQLVALNQGNAVQASELISSLVTSGKWTVLVGMAVSLLASASLAAFIVLGVNRDLRRLATALNDGADQVASASSQVSAASQSLASGSSEQAAALEETSASLEEMASMTKRNAESARQANALSSQTRAAADTGAADMDEMRVAMDAIKHSSDGISKIIKTIDEIAFQTNILALNAAVEAARAGDAGAGFAVVADEVRSLAQRSAQSAKETAGKIEEAIKKSEHGVRISTKVAKSLSEIVDKARQVDTLVAEIAQASNEQNQGISQVNTAVSQMDKITQSNAANAEETASASEELSAQADSQKEAVTELLQMVGAKQSSRPTMASAVAAPDAMCKKMSDGRAPQNGSVGSVRQARAPLARPAETAAAGGDAFRDF